VRTPPYAAGDEIREGHLYRRIKPDAGYYFEGKATHEAFRPRFVDQGRISAYLKEYVSIDDVATKHPAPEPERFGVCEFDIAAAREASGVRVIYRPNNRPNGHAHVAIEGCDDDGVTIILAGLAETVRPPRLA
jgi:hypothetical protein